MTISIYWVKASLTTRLPNNDMDSIFGIGPLELALILIIAGLVMGPERMVHTARWLGKAVAQMQQISQGLRAQLEKEVDTLDNDGQLRATVDELKSIQREVTTVRQEVQNTAVSTLHQAENSIQPPTPPPPTKMNGQNIAPPTTQPQDIPRVLHVPDDPE